MRTIILRVNQQCYRDFKAFTRRSNKEKNNGNKKRKNGENALNFYNDHKTWDPPGITYIEGLLTER